MTHENALRANQRDAASIVNDLLESIYLKDWEACHDLCWELTDTVNEMSENVRRLRIARDCGDVKSD